MPHLLLAALIFVVGWISQSAGADQAPLELVKDGTPRAAVVVPQQASPLVIYAAEELIEHIEKATGTHLPLLREPETGDHPHRIFLGSTQRAAEHGLPLEELPDDAFLMRVVSGDLFIAGSRDGQDPMNERVGAHAGTLYGVYEFLERFLAVRWLWPGELGTAVPESSRVQVPGDLDLQIAPAFGFRSFRTSGVARQARNYDETLGRLSFSREGIVAYARDLQIFKRRHRLGSTTQKPVVGHYFEGWWQRYGDKHPDWFAMRSDGVRGPVDDPTPWQLKHVPMCVSNPDLHRFIVEEAWDGGPILRLGEVDRRVFCQCPPCLAWDGEPVANPPAFADRLYEPQMVSNRYARFWKAILDRASERNPEVIVTTFLYWNYLPAPTIEIDFQGRVYGEFTPWGQDEITYWPMSEEAATWLKQQWHGWSRRGVQVAFRPNYLNGGYVMPHLSTRQVGEFLKFTAKQNQPGFDQDTLHGHWSVKGPMLYLHMRLSVDPDLSIAQIRREYFQAFGPAARLVEAYFNDWEEYAARRPGGNLFYAILAHVAYPQTVFKPAEERLVQALALAERSDDPRHAERVRFLQAGLEHARLSAYFMSQLHAGKLPTSNPERLQRARQALADLIAFRRKHEHLYIADYLHAASRENLRIDIDALLADVPETTNEETRIDLSTWEFRSDPDDQGLAAGWFKTWQTDPAWQPIEVPAFWAATVVGDYQGYGWYRIRFSIPEAWREDPLNLYFQGVDEQAWIFLNGQAAGEHSVASENKPIGELWNRPFTITLPRDRLNATGTNELWIRVHNAIANGGIWGEVRLYAASDLH